MRPSETSRVLALPVRAAYPDSLEQLLTTRLKTATGQQTLRPLQAQALFEAVRQRQADKERGIFVRAGVGTGKTLICLLLPTVCPPTQPGQRAIYLCPAGLRDKTIRELPAYCKDWKIRQDILSICSYEELSCDPELLTKSKAYMVICDEAQALKRMTSARTKRVLRASRANTSIVWHMLSATSSVKGLSDHAHLYELALREGSPIPRPPSIDLQAWASCLDSVCSAADSDWAILKPLVEKHGGDRFDYLWDLSGKDRQTIGRLSLNQRVGSTAGVITGDRVDVDSVLHLRTRKFPLPVGIQTALTTLAATGELPGSSGAAALGEQDLTRQQEQFSLGFYYRWAWERTTLKQPDQQWLGARKQWSSALTEYLASGGQGERSGIDTPAQVVLRMADMPTSVRVAWSTWLPYRDRYRIQYMDDDSRDPDNGAETIPVEPVWIDKALIDRMEHLLRDTRHSWIVWYKHRAVARELHSRGLRVVFSGEDMPWDSLEGDGKPVALSEYAHSAGLNLQAWSRMLIPCIGSSKLSVGAQVEQQIGRIHRMGQAAESCLVEIWQHADILVQNLGRFFRESVYIQESSGIPQRGLLAKREDVDESGT